jgi:pimeloyl-ACP methyl ester carboxylesterase
MPNRNHVLAIVCGAALLCAGPDTAQAECWLSACWQRYSQRSATAGRPAADKPLAADTDGAARTALGWFSRACLTDCLHNWAKGRRHPEYGLGALPAGLATGKRARLVLYLHGLNSRPEDLQGLIAEAEEAGILCATYRYPNDQSIDRSARQLAAEMRQLRRAYPQLRVVLVTHSMGGLVARAVVENPELDPGNVQRLIMIAPPNQGSYLAHYACSLDAWEYCTSAMRRREAGIVAGSIVDGLSEATRDLQPGSPFLRTLNQRARNPRVQYCLIIGTAGPIRPGDFAGVQRVMTAAGRRCRWMAATQRQVRERALAAEELFAGKGDGLVAVQRARLEGVDDVVLADFSHAGILDETDDAEVRRVREAILQRLGRRSPSSAQYRDDGWGTSVVDRYSDARSVLTP